MENKKIIIYQVFTRLFGNSEVCNERDGSIEENGCGKMNDFSDKVLQEIKDLGATHIWYTGLIAHASQTDYSAYGIARNHPSVVKGKAGSPYAIRDYYDIDPDLAVDVTQRMAEFEALVKRTHANGLKVIMDFVPNHVARQYHSYAKPEGIKDLGEGDDNTVGFDADNNFYYIPGHPLEGEIDFYNPELGWYTENPAKATGNDRFDAYPNETDWYETVKLNYGIDYVGHSGNHFQPIPDTWKKMKDIVLFWASKGIDGLRCDMAEMVPCEFWGWMIPQIKQVYPDLIFIAEVYNPNEYRNYLYKGKFDYLYDKVGLYDTLRALVCGYASASAITGCWQQVNDIQSHMLNFLENHDEQRIASDFFAGNPQKAFPALLVSACMNTNPMMIYFGQELGEEGMDCEGFSGKDGRTTIFDYWSIDTIRRWNNHGQFNDHLLNGREKEIRKYYQRVLNLCNNEKAIVKGSFFDLMYANKGGWMFNEHRQFAFLRKYKKELLFIIVNFDEAPVHVSVNVPQHAFDCLQITPMEICQSRDLLTDAVEMLSFTPVKPVSVDLPAWGGKILKIKC